MVEQRTFEERRAQRRDVPMIVGIGGPPGSGKTESALRLAAGMQAVRGGRVKLLDTEGGRCRQYADDFDFDEVPFEPPYRPAHFLAAVRQLAAPSPACIIVDSQSDEHEGEGGVLDWHERELSRMAGDDWAKRERVGQAAWIKPKAERQSMVHGYLRVGVPLILTFRSREKTKPLKDANGKTVPTNVGYLPIAPAEILFACSVKCLLPPFGQGVPIWQSEKVGEGFLLKLPRQFKPLFTEGRALSAEIGEALARWSLGHNIDSPAATLPSSGGERAAGANQVSAPAAHAFRLLDARGDEHVWDNAAQWRDAIVRVIETKPFDAVERMWRHNQEYIAAAEANGFIAEVSAIHAAWTKRQRAASDTGRAG